MGNRLFKGDGGIGRHGGVVTQNIPFPCDQGGLTVCQAASGVSQGFECRYLLCLQFALRGNLLAQCAGFAHYCGLHRRHDGAQVDIIRALAWLHHQQICGLSRHLLQRGIEAQDGRALGIELGALCFLAARYNRHARGRSVDLRLCCVNFSRQHRALGNKAVCGALGVACLLPQQFAAAFGGQRPILQSAQRVLLRIV